MREWSQFNEIKQDLMKIRSWVRNTRREPQKKLPGILQREFMDEINDFFHTYSISPVCITCIISTYIFSHIINLTCLANFSCHKLFAFLRFLSSRVWQRQQKSWKTFFTSQGKATGRENQVKDERQT